MSDQDNNNKPPIAYPTSKPSGIKINLDKAGSEASSMYKKMKKTRMLYSDKKKQESDLSEIKVDNEVASDDGFANDDPDNEDDLQMQDIAELARVAALKKVEENLKIELESDLEGRKDDIDPVEFYSEEVQEALKSAKETSRKFIDKKMHHNSAHKDEVISILVFKLFLLIYICQTEAVSYLHILLIMFCFIVLVVTLFAFKTLVKRKLSTVYFQV